MYQIIYFNLNRFPQFNLCFHNLKFVELHIELNTELYTELSTERYNELCAKIHTELSTELYTLTLTDSPKTNLGDITSFIIYSLLIH